MNALLPLVVLCAISSASTLADQWQGQDEDSLFSRRPLEPFSLRPPFFADRRWQPIGDAVLTDDFIRLTPDEQSRKGGLWSTAELKLNSGEGFEAEFSVKVGNGRQLGADGMAFWHVSSDYDIYDLGPTMGGSAAWKGIGVLLDSFDNDGSGGNPLIQVLWNDGSWVYTPDNDGSQHQLGSCRAYYRNNPEPTRIRVTYFDTQLRVQYRGGSLGDSSWTDCVTATVGDLGAIGGKIGFTAATGGLSDSHDVASCSVSALVRVGGDRQAEYTRVLQESAEMARRERENQQQQQQSQEASPPVAPPVPAVQENAVAPASGTSVPAPAPVPVPAAVPPQQQQQDSQQWQQQQQQQQHQQQQEQQQPPPPPPYPQIPAAASTDSYLSQNVASLQAAIQRLESSVSANAATLADISSTLRTLTASQEAVRAATASLSVQAGSSGIRASDLDPLREAISQVAPTVAGKTEELLSARIQGLFNQIQGVSTQIGDMRGRVDTTFNAQQQLERAVQQQSESGGSSGWIVLAVVIQVLLAVLFFFYKKWRVEKSTKLY